MKTKTFFILCLILGIATTQLFSQDKTMQYKVMNAEYHTNVFCNGVLVDFVSGEARLHIVFHGDFETGWWEIDQYKGEATGLYGEVFKISEIDFFSSPRFPYIIGHYSLNGNKGNNYEGFVTFNWDTWELIPGKTECN